MAELALNNNHSFYHIRRVLRGVLDTTLCDKVCQELAAGRWFSPVFFTNKSDRHNITEILLKVALNIITLTPNHIHYTFIFYYHTLKINTKI
jgi:hypothetical protein